MSSAPAGASTRTILSRMAMTAPVISLTASPRTRSAMSRPPIWAGVASPDIMMSNACLASSTLRARPSAALAISGLKSDMNGLGSVLHGGAGDPQKVLQNLVALLRRDALGMELHAMDRQRAMLHRHDHPVVGFRGDVQTVRQRRAVDDQRMVAGGLEGLRRSLEDALAGVGDHRQLAVHELRRPLDQAAKGLADRLVPEADAEQRHLGVARRLDEIEADPRLVRRARTRRQHDRLRPRRQHLADADLVVAVHHRLGAKLTEIVVEVEGEAVVVVDQDDHF